MDPMLRCRIGIPLASVLMALHSTAAGATVVISPADQAKLKSVADGLHFTVIEVRARFEVAATDSNDSSVSKSVVRYGSGVVIGYDLAVTTLHTLTMGGKDEVAKLADAIEVFTSKGERAGQVIGTAPSLDIAILRIPGGGPIPAPPLATEAPLPGDLLVAMGSGGGFVETVGVQVADAAGVLLTLDSNRMLDSRFWGGPVFDASGRLVAISLTSLMQPTAIAVDALKPLLDQIRDSDER